MKKFVVLPLATALASLMSAPSQAAPADSSIPADASKPQGDISAASAGEPNAFFTLGDDLLGFLITQQADGTIVAQHRSHSSHSSHSSHHSHYSSR